MSARRLAAAVLFWLAAVAPAAAQVPQQLLVNRATATLERLMADDTFRSVVKPRIDRAAAVVVVPEAVGFGLLFGGGGGEGVVMTRVPGGWGYPAFIQVKMISLGAQVGFHSISGVIVIDDLQGLDAMFAESMALGMGLDVTFGPLGGSGMGGAVVGTWRSDVVMFGHSIGLFGGLSAKMVGVVPDATATASYYGAPVSVRDVLQGKAANAGADRLRRALDR